MQRERTGQVRPPQFPVPSETGTVPVLRKSRITTRADTVTTSPDVTPPPLICPTCDVPLSYMHTVVSGTKPIESWHHLTCRKCGLFVYRDRTRKLRTAI